jgi:hypothetical protein
MLRVTFLFCCRPSSFDKLRMLRVTFLFGCHVSSFDRLRMLNMTISFFKKNTAPARGAVFPKPYAKPLSLLGL